MPHAATPCSPYARKLSPGHAYAQVNPLDCVCVCVHAHQPNTHATYLERRESRTTAPGSTTLAGEAESKPTPLHLPATEETAIPSAGSLQGVGTGAIVLPASAVDIETHACTHTQLLFSRAADGRRPATERTWCFFRLFATALRHLVNDCLYASFAHYSTAIQRTGYQRHSTAQPTAAQQPHGGTSWLSAPRRK